MGLIYLKYFQKLTTSMFGDEPYKEYLEQFVFNQLNLRANVTFAGAMSDKDITDCYYECELFTMIRR